MTSAITPSDIGSGIIQICAVITGLWGVGMLLVKLWFSRVKRDVQSTVKQLLADELIRQCDGRDPKSYWTLDVHFEHGPSIAVPMFMFAEALIADQLHIAVIDHTEDETTLALWTQGFATLSPHSHHQSCERIIVERGYVTCMETGVRYTAGETWKIEQGVIHSAWFSENFFGYCKHRPALPTAAERPVNLSGLDKLLKK